MNSIDRDITNDFEPRKLPKPAPRFDSPMPSVPEVSLVFEKPAQDVKSFDYNTRRSPSIDKYDSYATWKQNAILSNAKNVGHSTFKPRPSVGSSLERCHSQTDANQLHKNVLTNESLRHSRSDSSLTKKIDALNITQGYEREFSGKLTHNRQITTPSMDNMMRSKSHGQLENNLRFHDGEKHCYLQERNREAHGDRERQQNTPHSTQKNDERYYTRSGNPRSRPQQADLDPKYSNCDSNTQKLGVNQPNRLHSESMNPSLQHPSFHPGNLNNPNFHPNMFPRYHQYPTYYDSEYGYPYPHPYSPNIQSQKSETEETVKNLLQLINNQSEQMKSLQSQVERLLKIQEENLKDREKCNCSRNLGLINENYEQNTQFSIHTTNNNPVHNSSNGLKLTREDTMVSQRHNGTMERNMIGSTNLKEMKKNLTCDYNGQNNHDSRSNPAARDEQLKNKILEQKVSIGVMTSFEFTVQNNPFAQETDDNRPYYGSTQTENDKVYSQNENEQVSEQVEISRTSQNVFSRVSNLPLENIIEDSESHLSLSQQPSSNFHSNPTIDECKLSEPTNRKITKNISSGINLEYNQNSSYDKNLEDTQEYARENYFSNQKRQFLDIHEDFENTQRSQSPKRTDVIPTTQDSHTDNLPKRYYSEIKTPGPPDRHRQDSNDQNKNVRTPVPHKLAMNGNPQYNLQKESNSPYRFEDRRHLNEAPRSQQSPAAYINEKNRMLSRSKSNQDNCIEESMVLNSGELEINEQPPPSPEPSIHVEMQEYSSDEESDRHGGEGDKQTPKVGWTFYNNVLGQVNQILQNTPITKNLKDTKIADGENVMEDLKNKATVETVKMATMEQLRQLGISFVDTNDLKDSADTSNKKVTFDSSYYPRLEYRGNMTQATSTISETDTSMHMNALALKYLSDEQLGELALQKHSAETLKQLMVSNVQGTNMSFATMRYLERYQLLPTNNNPQVDVMDILAINTDERRPLERPGLEEMRNAQKPPSTSQMPRMSCPSKILDISTLKQQPKLL